MVYPVSFGFQYKRGRLTNYIDVVDISRGKDYNCARIRIILITMKDRFTTTHRQLLLEILREANRHLNAKELFQEAVNIDPHISLATVYRNLRLFEELGLVAERRLDRGHCSYEMKTSSEHYHLVCTTCGKVTEFESPAVNRLVDEVQHNSGFAVTRAVLHLEGYCPECTDKAKGH